MKQKPCDNIQMASDRYENILKPIYLFQKPVYVKLCDFEGYFHKNLEHILICQNFTLYFCYFIKHLYMLVYYLNMDHVSL